MKFCVLVLLILPVIIDCYDPDDPEVSSVIPPKGTFEAFYPRGQETGSSRASHLHGSFYKHRNPALVDAKNAAAYGFRFDGGIIQSPYKECHHDMVQKSSSCLTAPLKARAPNSNSAIIYELLQQETQHDYLVDCKPDRQRVVLQPEDELIYWVTFKRWIPELKILKLKKHNTIPSKKTSS
ncbi:hypothetical protein FQR65_LT00497 [Abscondita terminalis]|nr:hypothetical protein FQR65_LT00497 [Abscondita terminalis]